MLFRSAKVAFLSKRDTGDQSKAIDVNNNTKCDGKLNDIQKVVLDSIRNSKSEIGICLDEILSINRSVKQETIKSTIEFLLKEGHIYELGDDTHFKSYN